MLECEVVSVLAYCQVEYSKTEWAKHDRLSVFSDWLDAAKHLCEIAPNELSMTGELLGQMQRRVGATNVFYIVSDVVRLQDHFRRKVAQRHVQDRRVFRTSSEIGNIRSGGSRCKRDERATF